MMPDMRVRRIIVIGFYAALLFMLLGILVSLTGHYSEAVKLSFENLASGRLFTDGAGLMYIGTLFLIATPVAVLVYLTAHYALSNTKRYALLCILMMLVLAITVIKGVK